jgi:CubicO group peptidase (beta-lactamase class C family)
MLSGRQALSEKIGSLLDPIFSDIGADGPGVAVGVARGSVPVYRRGFGLASAELPVLLNSSTRFRIASTTKHFACLAWMLLCEEGLASLDDQIGLHLPELHPVAARVTMRQLMGQLSGLRDAHDICWQSGGLDRLVSSDELLAVYRSVDDTNAIPGTEWRYCNGAYVLLSAAIERVAGQSLDDVLAERIFAPVGMHDTLLRRWNTDFVANSASLHALSADGALQKNIWGTAHCGEGGIVSTVDDLLRWLRHMDAPTVGAAATWDAMLAPMQLNNGTSTGYGMGLFRDSYGDHEVIHHPGGLFGGNCQILKVPKLRLDIVVLVNRHDISSVEIAWQIIDRLSDVGPTVAKLASVRIAHGTYRSAETGRVIELIDAAGEQIVVINGQRFLFTADGAGGYVPIRRSAYLKFRLRLGDDSGAPSLIEFTDFGTTDRLDRQACPDDLPATAGRYRCKATGLEALIDDAAASLRLQGQFGSANYALEPIARRIWRARARTSAISGGVLVFANGGQEFAYSTLRTANLAFARQD